MSYSAKDYYEVRRVSGTPSDRKCVMLSNGQPAWRDSRGRLWNASGREIDRCGRALSAAYVEEDNVRRPIG